MMGDSSGEECALQIDVGKSEAVKGGRGSGKKKKSAKPPVNWTPGEVVWAKVTGFSYWPAKVFDADNDKLVPEWMKPAPKPTYILVRFFGTYDMQWVSGNSTESYEKGLKKKFQKKSKSKSFLKAINEAKQFVDSGAIPEGLTQRPLDPPDMETEENEETEDKSNTSQDDDSSAQSGTNSRRSRRKGAPRRKSSSSADVSTPASKKPKMDSSIDDGETKSKSSEVKAFTSAPLPQCSSSMEDGEDRKKREDEKPPSTATDATDEVDKLTNGGATNKTGKKSSVENTVADS